MSFSAEDFFFFSASESLPLPLPAAAAAAAGLPAGLAGGGVSSPESSLAPFGGGGGGVFFVGLRGEVSERKDGLARRARTDAARQTLDA